MKLLALVLVTLALVLPAAADNAPYAVTNPNSMEKVQPDAKDAGPAATTLRIAMAKGEYEPVQIVVTPTSSELKGLQISTSKLVSVSGAEIPASRVVVNKLGYVHCSVVSPGANIKGDLPDVMLPVKPINLAAGRHQPYYVTVQTKMTDAPGIYKGSVTISAKNAAKATLPLLVHVYNVTIPVKSHLKTGFALWGYFNLYDPATKTNRKLFMDTYMRYAKLMLAYRITPIVMWTPKKNADGSYDFSDYDRYVKETLPLGLTTLNIGDNWVMAVNADTAWAKAAEKHFKEKGWWDLHYVYGMDEASPDTIKTLVNNYSALIKAVPDLKIVQTGWSYNPQLKDLVKIWCPLTPNADPNGQKLAKENGDEFWWYVCVVPTAPYANLFIDYPGVDQRVLGWQTYKAGIQGFLYWAMDVWMSNPKPVKEYVDAEYANWETCTSSDNSDGLLLYPGLNGTPVPSMRMALLRDGFEDYDLFTEVNALAAKSNTPAAEQAKALLKLDGTVTSLTDYTKNGNKLLARREAILKAGEELAAM